MKATKKLFALFLAMTVLFTVCSISVFATVDDSWIRTVDDDEIDDIWEVIDALKNATPEQIDRILDIL